MHYVSGSSGGPSEARSSLACNFVDALFFALFCLLMHANVACFEHALQPVDIRMIWY
jgi:hypothetical protein